MINLTQFAATCRQHGVPFRIVFTESASFAVLKGGIKDSPIQLALAERGARVTAHNGDEGVGYYYKLESLT